MPLASRAFWMTSSAVLILDSVFLPIAYHLPAGWLLSLIGFTVNLPALPLAAAYSIALDDPISLWTAFALNASLVLASSVVWGAVAATIVWRHHRKESPRFE
jgi:hypothetical protein